MESLLEEEIGMRRILLLAAVLLPLLITGCEDEGEETTAAGVDGEEAVAEEPVEAETLDAVVLLEERCTSCHSLDKVESAEHDRAGWKETLETMIGYGAELDDAEQAALLDHLTS